MESREGAVRSSSRESDKQMGSDWEETSWRLLRAQVEVGAGRDGVGGVARGALWIQTAS